VFSGLGLFYRELKDYSVICRTELDQMESCMRKHPDEFGDEDIKMFEETVRSGFKFRDFLGFSRSLWKQNKSQ